MARGRVLVTVAGMGAIILVISACGASSSLDGTDVESQIGTALAEEVGGSFAVDCPADIPAEEGYTFTCEVDDSAGGVKVQVTVTEDDASGAFSWRVMSGAPGAGSASAPGPG